MTIHAHFAVIILGISLMMGCYNSEMNTNNTTTTLGGLSMENLSDKEIGILDVSFDGESQFSFIILGAGAKKAVMGQISSVHGVPTVEYTEGRIGDAFLSVDMEVIHYSGGLDRLTLQLGEDERWVLIGENDGSIVFRAFETARNEVPATNTNE